jgi:hypothetical protein
MPCYSIDRLADDSGKRHIVSKYTRSRGLISGKRGDLSGYLNPFAMTGSLELNLVCERSEAHGFAVSPGIMIQCLQSTLVNCVRHKYCFAGVISNRWAERRRSWRNAVSSFNDKPFDRYTDTFFRLFYLSFVDLLRSSRKTR